MSLLKIKNRLTTNDFLKNALMLMTGTTIAQAIPTIVSPLLTRIYTPEEHGTLALFTAIVTVISVIATLRYELAIMLPSKDEDAINIFFLGVIIALLVSTVSLIIISVFNNQLVGLLNNPELTGLLYLVPLMVFFIGLFQCMHYWMSRNRQYKKLATAQVTRSGVKAGIQLGAGYSIPSVGTTGLITGAVLGQLIATLVLWFQAGKELTTRFKYINKEKILEQAKEHKKFPLINAAHALVNNLSTNLPVILLTSFFSSKVAGYYSLALMVVMLPISLISNAIGQVFYQRISHAYNKGEDLYPLVIRLVKGLFLIAIVPFLLLFTFAPWLFGIIFGQEWTEAGNYTRIFVFWIIMRFIVSPMSYIPLTLGFQAKALRIELMGISAVILALIIGGLLENVNIALILLSLFSFSILSYSFLWIITISKRGK